MAKFSVATSFKEVRLNGLRNASAKVLLKHACENSVTAREGLSAYRVASNQCGHADRGPRRSASGRGERADERTGAIAAKVLYQPSPSRLMAPVQRLVMHAAVDLLPGWARRMHGLHRSPLVIPLVRGATVGIAQTMRWTFAGQ